MKKRADLKDKDLKRALKASDTIILKRGTGYAIHIRSVPGYHITNSLSQALAYAEINHCDTCGYYCYRNGFGCACCYA